ncbi:MAG: sigma 54-interacting transcriptional regulator [Planctomycetes bacterium]|nr:sigma 54-interacting transcriptional regulator [Planctomycetota bacterium]
MGKNKPLSERLDLIRALAQKSDWLKIVRCGEETLRKLARFSHTPQELFSLYIKLGNAYFPLQRFSDSLNAYYKAYLIATKHSLKESIIMASRNMGSSFLNLKDVKSALVQFQKVELHFENHGDVFSPPLDKEFYNSSLIGLGYCYLYTNQLGEAKRIIDKISSLQSSLTKLSGLGLEQLEHLRGEFFISAKDYANARQSFRECVKIGQKFNLTAGILNAQIHLASLDIKEGNLDSSIQTLKDIFRKVSHNKFNGLIGESGLLLSKCYYYNGASEKSLAIENKIRPVLSKLDTVWLYEKTKEFGEVFGSQQATLPGRKKESSPVPETLVKILNGRYESSSRDIVLGKSDAMREVWHLVEKVAQTDLPILIQGETGTGKGLIARAIHQNSPRKDNDWLAFNSGALPETLIEDYLFGHIKGAYTGAEEDRKDYIELASGGTLFIGELAVMSLATQQKLLRVLEDGEIWRIGAQKSITINTRFIFASNQDVSQMVKDKLFREDLFYRINTITITLPPLRERKEDIPLLIERFFKKYADGLPIANQWNCWSITPGRAISGNWKTRCAESVSYIIIKKSSLKKCYLKQSADMTRKTPSQATGRWVLRTGLMPFRRR